jgi:hypothetical protein
MTHTTHRTPHATRHTPHASRDHHTIHHIHCRSSPPLFTTHTFLALLCALSMLVRICSCSKRCYADFAIRTNSAAMRRVVFRRDRGVCEACGLDAHGLCSALRAESTTRARRQVLLRMAPNFRPYPKAVTRLCNGGKVFDGLAWHVDHIRAVYMGGGQCSEGNCRTLCVPCHLGITKVQTTQRAHARRGHGMAHAGSAAGRSGGVPGSKTSSSVVLVASDSDFEDDDETNASTGASNPCPDDNCSDSCSEWQCPNCTNENDGSASLCELCETEKPAYSPP